MFSAFSGAGQHDTFSPAEGGWLVRPAKRQGRDHGDGVSLDAIHLLLDLRDLLV
jgi:hypothetical protein